MVRVSLSVAGLGPGSENFLFMLSVDAAGRNPVPARKVLGVRTVDNARRSL